MYFKTVLMPCLFSPHLLFPMGTDLAITPCLLNKVRGNCVLLRLTYVYCHESGVYALPAIRIDNILKYDFRDMLSEL